MFVRWCLPTGGDGLGFIGSEVRDRAWLIGFKIRVKVRVRFADVVGSCKGFRFGFRLAAGGLGSGLG